MTFVMSGGQTMWPTQFQLAPYEHAPEHAVE
jgi:hypothetical protein